ncbi:YjbH domain-containing protein [Labilibaculum sp. DW002]|uniref:YjbH domain-containing protein n=1 Tax=Paralabilibaculum antarcticum TaxID=2912572 RepID=A0ABT5VQH2_9BACT|nr:YjbH domain-containing protein [Labilibaculum sp. DW002]MDE5417542.1 YjbH domain-containing protein [Labilibaculum sp. DW002]
MPNLTLEVRRFLSILFFVCLPAWLCAQATSGSIGLLNIPSAEMQKDGTFLFGANYLPQEFTPSRLSYDSGNYYLNLTFLPFMEVNYRMVLLQNAKTSKYTEQDRTFGLKLKLFKEKKILPAIAIGGGDIYSEHGDDVNKTFGSYYAVSSKNLKLKACNVGVTMGFGFNDSPASENTQVHGFFGGVSVTPSCLQQVSFVAEYDSNTLNVGATALLFKHLYLHAFVHDFENVVGGFAYKIYLKK